VSDALRVETTPLAGVVLLHPRVFADERGWFFESFNAEVFGSLGLETRFVQDNHSRSTKGTLRGLHFQRTPGQAKLVRCTRGRIFDVVVDIRPQSATFGKWHGVELDAESMTMALIPVGFAHGFCVLSDVGEVQYKCSSLYDGATEAGIAWDDPELAIPWPVSEPKLSNRDLSNPSFAAYRSGADILPRVLGR
jgi:dTDP-4-dehydrorhamnose 3,5-epimerase